jgi:hypothetical protein
MDEGSKINPADIRDLIGKDWSPERWRFGAGVRGCAIPDGKKSRRAIKAKPRKKISPAPFGTGRVCGRLRWPADGSEWGGDFVKPRMALDGLGELLNPKINRALADAVAVGVAVNPRQCAWLADGEHDVVKLAVWFGDHRMNGAAGVTAGGVFIGSDVAGIGQVAGANAAGSIVVAVIGHDGQVGDVALLLLPAHVTQNGVRDLLLVELRLAGLVEISGGRAKLFVGEIVRHLVNGDVAGAKSVTVKDACDASAQGGGLVNVRLKGKPVVMLAGGINFGIPLARG